MKLNRNIAGVFFKISGFTQTEIDDIWIRTPIIKEALESAKLRKRQERQLINYVNEAYKRFGDMLHVHKIRQNRPTKREKVAAQIQNGFDVADKWRKEYERRIFDEGLSG